MIGRRLLLALTLVASPLMAAPQNPLAAAGKPLEFGRSFEVPSRVLGEMRRVNVSLPQGYDDPENAAIRYPVIYLLDGGAGWQDFFHIAAMVRHGGTWGASAAVIVVGIESRDRRAEFTRPSADAKEQKDFPTHGKAEAFRRFVVEELKPLVAGAYRTTDESGVIGESLAGLFVVDVALRNPESFDRYIAISPSLWWDGQRLSRESRALLAAMPPGRRTIWLSIADETDGMREGLNRVRAALTAQGRGRIDVHYVPFPAETHATIYHPAAVRAVRTLFPSKP